MVTFRKYRFEDFNELVEMVLGLYTKDGAKPSHMSAEKVALSVENLQVESNNGQILIFEKNAVVIGYSIINHFWSNEFSGRILYIDELYIKPSARNLGIGRLFFEHLDNNASMKSVAFMLETTEDNIKAIGFYEKIGFNKHHNHLMFKLLQ